MGPSTSALSHQHYAMTVGAESYTLHTVLWNFFPQKFPSSYFPLSTSHHFHFLIDIPSELAPWHHSPCSKTEPGLRSESVFEEQRLIEALNQAWIFTSEFTSPSACPYLSLHFPVAILYHRCSKSLSLPLHFRCPWSGLGFLLDVKGGGVLFKVLMLVVACETCWLNSSHMDF